MSVRYSVIVPMFNEQEVIHESYKRLRGVMEGMGESYELIFVDDGSRDETLRVMRQLRQEDGHIHIIALSRNFGHQAAVTAGLDYARGEAVVIIDADLQDPPEVIPQMAEKWRQGYEVVYGKRVQRQGETAFKKLTARAFYRIMNKLSDGRIPQDTGDFRLIDRKVLEAMRGMRETSRFLRGMVAWVGFKQTPQEFIRDERWAGETKYPLRKMLKLAADGITSFSYKPLGWAGKIGGMLAVLSILYELLLSALALFTPVFIPGWHYAFAALLFVQAMLFVSLSIMGGYIGRIFEQSKGRPIYLVSKAEGFEE